MKKYIFILISIVAIATLQNCSDATPAARKFSSGGLHHVDACVEKIDRIIDQVSKTLARNSSKDDSFKAQIITHIAIATIDSGSPRIFGTPEPITSLEAKTNLLAAYAILETKSYHETSPHCQSRRLYMAARQYKAAIES
jgi:hypothetical protein